MSGGLSSSERLQRLEQILTGSKLPRGGGAGDDRDAVSRQLETVPLERIQRLTAELLESRDRNDDIDAVTLRLLLNDYAAAVANLRVFVRQVAERVDAAADPLREARRFMWREVKRQERGTYRAGDRRTARTASPGPTQAPSV
jgi:hypothetical protein